MRLGRRWLQEIHLLKERFGAQASQQLKSFKCLWETGAIEELFKELVFCLLTPQSPALRCWQVTTELFASGSLWTLSLTELSEKLRVVRFRHTKARRILKALASYRNGLFHELVCQLQQLDGTHYDHVIKARALLVQHVEGFGQKEASHFLRNAGFTANIAILDRHILREMAQAGAIPALPRTLTPRRYLELEKLFFRLAEKTSTTPAQLDLLLWAKATGFVFK